MSFEKFQASERNGSALECHKPASASSGYTQPNWCTPHPAGATPGEINQDDGETCTVGSTSSECKGVCAPAGTGASTAGICALSDYQPTTFALSMENWLAFECETEPSLPPVRS